MKNLNLRTDLLLGPSLATGDWTPESTSQECTLIATLRNMTDQALFLAVVWDTGFIPAYNDALTALTVEQ